MIIIRLGTLAGIAGLVLAPIPVRGNIAFDAIPEPGTPQYVVDAFSLATARWSAVLGDDITVNINFGYQSLPAADLGDTTSYFVQQNYSDVIAALNAGATSPDHASAYSHLQSGPTYSRLVNHTADNPNGSNSATPYVNSLAPVLLTRANAKAPGFLGPRPSPE